MLKKSVLISTILVACAGVQAQTSASFSVAGTVNPPSCVLTLNDGTANVDLGVLTAPNARSKPTAGGSGSTGAAVHYALDEIVVPWKVACTAPMPVELVLEDGKAGKVSPMDANDSKRHGLVDAASVSVGSVEWSITSTPIVADGANAYGYFQSTKGSTAWGSPLSGANKIAPGTAFSIAKLTTSTAPLWASQANGTLSAKTYVKKAKVDAAVAPVVFSGSAVFTLQYL
jgi:hypothetical protein